MAEIWGYLPLGLAQAAAVIVDQDISCREYRSWFADRAQTLDDLFPAGADPDGYGQHRRDHVGAGHRRRRPARPDGLARPIAHLIAIFDPAGVPEPVLTSQTLQPHRHPGRHTTRPRGQLARTAAPPQDTDRSTAARAALRALDRLSLISHDPDLRTRGQCGCTTSPPAPSSRPPHPHGRAWCAPPPTHSLEAWPDVENQPALSEALRANTAALDTQAPTPSGTTDGGAPGAVPGRPLPHQRRGRSPPPSPTGPASTGSPNKTSAPTTADTLATRNNLADAYQEAGRLDDAIALLEAEPHRSGTAPRPRPPRHPHHPQQPRPRLPARRAP